MSNSPAFITISGVAGSGKTTVTEYLRGYFRQLGYSVNDFSFAGPLKDALCMWFGWDRQRLDTDFLYKEGCTLDDGSPDPYCERLNMTRREAMQQFGTEAMRRGMHPEFWIMLADVGVRLGKIPHSDIYVISDARMINELEWAKSIDAYRLFVIRQEIEEGRVVNGATLTTHSGHSSEQEFQKWNGYDENLINLIDRSLKTQENMDALVKLLQDVTIPAISERFQLKGQL